MKHVALIDGKNFVFRHHFTHRTLATSGGEPTSVLFGCLQGLLTMAKRLPETSFVFVWDGGGATWRHALLQRETQTYEKKSAPTVSPGLKQDDWFTQQVHGSFKFMEGLMPKPSQPPATVVRELKGYKENRQEFYQKHSDAADDRAKAGGQIPELRRILKMLNFRQFRINGLEGDDLIGILATAAIERELFEHVVIVSTDKDFYQLMGERVHIWDEKGNGYHSYLGPTDVWAKHGVVPEDWAKYRALSGDPSDNIPPAVPGIGPKTAINLLAAGVDPSVKDYRDLGYNVRLKMGDMKVRGIGIVNWVKVWPDVVRNYSLCKILRDGNCAHLSSAPREEIQEVLASLRRADFLRYKPSEETFRKFTEWLVSKEMESLMGARQAFWEIGI